MRQYMGTNGCCRLSRANYTVNALGSMPWTDTYGLLDVRHNSMRGDVCVIHEESPNPILEFLETLVIPGWLRRYR